MKKFAVMVYTMKGEYSGCQVFETREQAETFAKTFKVHEIIELNL